MWNHQRVASRTTERNGTCTCKKNPSEASSWMWHTQSIALSLSKATISWLIFLSKTGILFNQEFSRRDHLNKECRVLTSSATHPYPALSGKLLSATSFGGSSLVSIVTSIAPSPASWPLPSLPNWPLPSPPNYPLPLPELDDDTLPLTLDIPFHTHTSNFSQTLAKEARWPNISIHLYL